MFRDRPAPQPWLWPLMLLLSACGEAPQGAGGSDAPSPGAQAPSGNAARHADDPEKTADVEDSNVDSIGASPNSNTVTGFPADMVVIRANGPSGGNYPIGRTLVSGTQLSLMAGDRLVLLGDGGTQVLAGPGTFLSGGADFPAGAAQNTSLLYAAALFQADGQSAAAATRRMIAPPNIANVAKQMPPGLGLWAYALGTSGNHCLSDLRDFVVSTRPASFARTITITPLAGGAARSLSLAVNSGRAGRYGPPMTNGARYRIGFGGGNGATMRIIHIAVDRGNPAALASTLARSGCSAQLDRLLARLNGVAPPAPPLVASPPPRPVIVRTPAARPVLVIPDRPIVAAPVPPRNVPEVGTIPHPRIEVRPVPPHILSPRPRVISPTAPVDPVNPAVRNSGVNE